MTVAKAAVAPGAEPQELVGVDIKSVIRPSLAQIKAVIIDKVHEARCVHAWALLWGVVYEMDVLLVMKALTDRLTWFGLRTHTPERACCACWTRRPRARRSWPRRWRS
jgi:hypothetical protein